MKIGAVCIIKNVLTDFYLGNPVIVTGNEHNYSILSVYLIDDYEVYYKAVLQDVYLEYIGSDDILNYINIL